jgi:hypothetical protein
MKKQQDRTPVEQLSEVLLVEESSEMYGKGRFVLIGEDGNAHAIMARVSKALRKAGWGDRAVELVMEDMRSDVYDHLLQVAMRVQHPIMRKIEYLRSDLEAQEAELWAELEGEER